jgi:hypothetical protein
MPDIRSTRMRRNPTQFQHAAQKLAELANWLSVHVLAIVAYVHTVELFFPRSLSYAARQHILTLLRKLDHPKYADDPRRGIRFKPSVYDGDLQGYRLIVNEPSLALLRVLDQLAVKYGATVSRVDVAIDWRTRKTHEAEWLVQYLLKYTLLRWRRKQDMRDVATWWPTTYYWCGKKRSRRSRDLVLYLKNDGRYGDRDYYAHLELRFFSTQSCRGRHQGWYRPRDLLALNPAHLFDHHLRLNFDIDRYIDQSIRREVRDLMTASRDHPRASTPAAQWIEARFESGRFLARRCRQLWNVLGHDRAQWLKDHAPRSIKTTVSIEVMAIPTELAWPVRLEGGPRTALVMTTPETPAQLTPPIPKTPMESTQPLPNPIGAEMTASTASE